MTPSNGGDITDRGERVSYGPLFARSLGMKRYRTVEVGYMGELWDIADDEVTVRETDSVPLFHTPDDQEPQWLE